MLYIRCFRLGVRLRRFAQAIAIASAAHTIVCPWAFAQGDGAGAVIGKENKTISGSRSGSAEQQSSDGPVRAASALISGQWSWQATCENRSAWTGEFSFEQSPEGKLNGTCRTITGAGSCGALSGRVVGNKVTLTVYWLDVFGGHKNPYEFTIAASGQSMRGTEKSQSSGICTYQVKRRSR